jgi:hypothetical protein
MQLLSGSPVAASCRVTLRHSAKVLSGFLTPPILFFFERSIHRRDELLVFHKLVLRGAEIIAARSGPYVL